MLMQQVKHLSVIHLGSLSLFLAYRPAHHYRSLLQQEVSLFDQISHSVELVVLVRVCGSVTVLF